MNKDFKYQWSSKLDNGEIMVVRADTREELVLDMEWAKSLSSPVTQEKGLESHPEASQTPIEDVNSLFEEAQSLNEKYAGKTNEEIPEVDESYCQLHEVKMKERIGKNGKFYSHSQGDYPDLNWCSGKGYK